MWFLLCNRLLALYCISPILSDKNRAKHPIFTILCKYRDFSTNKFVGHDIFSLSPKMSFFDYYLGRYLELNAFLRLYHIFLVIDGKYHFIFFPFFYRE